MICLLLTALPSFAASAAGLVEQGNKAFSENRLDEAIAAYDQAMEKAPDSPQVLFNKGCALYMKGEYDAAADLFEKAAVLSREPGLEAKSHFNLGNSTFQKGRSPAAGSDPGNVVQDLERSIRHYEKALELDPGLEPAGQNLELARRTLNVVLEEMEKQQQMAEQQQKAQQEMQEELKDLADRQERLAEASRQAGEPQPADTGSQPDPARMTDDQAALREQTRQLNEKMAGTAGPEKNKKTEQLRQQLAEAMEQQAAAGEQLKQPDFNAAADNQEKAAEAMRQALAEMKKTSEENTGECSQGKPGDDQDKSGENRQSGSQENAGQEKKDPGDPSAMNTGEPEPSSPAAATGTEDPEKILLEEQRHRQDREAIAGGGYAPVEKDW